MGKRGVSWTPDPDVPTVPYSQQRKYLLYLIEIGLQQTGDAATARVQLDLYALEVWDESRACADDPNPFPLGKPGQGDM